MKYTSYFNSTIILSLFQKLLFYLYFNIKSQPIEIFIRNLIYDKQSHKNAIMKFLKLKTILIAYSKKLTYFGNDKSSSNLYADSLLSTSSLPAGMFEQIRHLKTYNCTSRIFYCPDLRKRQVRKHRTNCLKKLLKIQKRLENTGKLMHFIFKS